MEILQRHKQMQVQLKVVVVLFRDGGFRVAMAGNNFPIKKELQPAGLSQAERS